MSSTIWLVLADLVLYVHFAFVLFVILGLLLVVAGGMSGWRWVRNPWFRYAHLAGIGVVVAQAWVGIICPLTTLEQYLRRQAGGATYEGSYIAHWVSELLFLDFPTWVFTVIYTVFGLLVVASWLWIRPRGFRHLRLSR
ncbi:MAG: DUF2784 domain-containing protein [Pseudomonadota bacterium]